MYPKGPVSRSFLGLSRVYNIQEKCFKGLHESGCVRYIILYFCTICVAHPKDPYPSIDLVPIIHEDKQMSLDSSIGDFNFGCFSLS